MRSRSRRQRISIWEFSVMALTTANSSAGVMLRPSRVRAIWTEPQKRALSRNFSATSESSCSKGGAGSRKTVSPDLLPFITTVLCILLTPPHTGGTWAAGEATGKILGYSQSLILTLVASLAPVLMMVSRSV